MPGRAARVAAWATFAVTCALVTTGVGLHGLGGARFGEDAALALGFTGLGALVLSRDPRNRAGWICLTAVLAAVAYAAQAYADAYAGAGADVAGWLGAWVWVPGLLPVGTVLLLVLPDGRLPGPRWRPVAWFVTVVIVVLSTGLALFAAQTGAGASDGGPAAPGSVAEVLVVVLVLVCALGCLSGLLVRTGRARADERARLLWIVLGAVVLVLGSNLNFLLPPPWPAVVAQGSALALPVGIGVAVLRHRLYDLNPLLRRLVLTLTLAVVVLALFLALRAVLGGGTVTSGVVTVGLALVTPVLARWLGEGVDRVVWGRGGDPAVTAAGLGRRLAATAQPEDALADVVMEALPVLGVRIVLDSGGDVLRRVERGDADVASTHTVALGFGGTHLGRIEVAAPAGLDGTERALLDDLAVTAAAAMAAAHRSWELRRSREQLVVAREQERRRIARDLHDGVGPVLSGLGFTLDALRVALHDRPDDEDVAARAGTQVRAAAALVRGLSRGLRPTGLDQLGLAGALAELAAQHTAADLRVHLEAPEPFPIVAAAAEVAIFAIAAEALTNVARHAAATCCRIVVRFDGPKVAITVTDDGIGLDGSVAGTGRMSMIERADELGGLCTITGEAGRGTTVSAVLPDGGPR